MNRQRLTEFQDRVKILRDDGKTIRAIASELGVPKSNVHRAVKALDPNAGGKTSLSTPFDVESFPHPSTLRGLDRPSSHESARDRPFVGRTQEMGQLRQALEESINGRSHLAMLVGEPGIGKTRISQEIADYARSRETLVLRGRCYENMGTPPYWPWVQAIGSYVRECDPERLRSEMGAGASDIAEIVPDIRTNLHGLEPSARLEPEQARMRLFDSIASFLKAAARTQPLVLVLDNLHWADVSSLLLLEFVTQELGEARILIVCSYRDTEVSLAHPLSRTLGELTKAPHYQRLQLNGLTGEDVGVLIEMVSGLKPSQTLTGQVHNRTGGNPLFITEVVRLLAPEMAADAESGPSSTANAESWNVKIPEGVREAIGTRLYRMSPETNRVLAIASAVGREFSLDLLRRLIPDITVDALLEAMDEGLAARVIEEIPGALGGYQFGHALIQETLYAELSSTRRAQLHASIAEALEERYGHGSATHASELVYHYARAEAVTGTTNVVYYSLLAGESALESYAWDEALSHFQLGLKAKGLELTGLASAPDQVAADLLFGLGRAQLAIAQSTPSNDAVTNFTRAFDRFVHSEEVEQAVGVAVYPLPLIAGSVTGAKQLITRAMDLVPADSLQAGRLQASYGRVLGIEEVNYEAAREAFNSALDIAEQNNDSALELEALSFACDVDGYHINLTEALEKGLRAVELARLIDNPRAELMARMWCVFSLTTTGDLSAATGHAAAMLPLWERLRHPQYGSRALYAIAAASYSTGDFDSALGFSDRGLAAAPTDPRLLKCRVLLEYDLGNFEAGFALLNRFVEIARHSAPGPNVERAFAAIAIAESIRFTGITDLVDTAEEFSRTVLDSPTATPGVTAFARIGSCLLSAFGGNTITAAKRYVDLVESPGAAFGSLGGWPAGRVLGLLASTVGRLEEAAAHFEDSLDFCRQGGYRPALAWTCHDYAEALLNPSARAGQTDEERRVKVRSLLHEALSISSELGMPPLTERVAALQQMAEQQFGPGPTYPDGLTAREVEVLRLIASGLNNREIAANLVVSARTVERHITNLYGKIKARGRADATNYVVTHELSEGD